MKINKDILIEDLVGRYPATVKFLRENGIRCLACGEPIWGTLAEAASEKNFSEEEINTLVTELNMKFCE